MTTMMRISSLKDQELRHRLQNQSQLLLQKLLQLMQSQLLPKALEAKKVCLTPTQKMTNDTTHNQSQIMSSQIKISITILLGFWGFGVLGFWVVFNGVRLFSVL